MKFMEIKSTRLILRDLEEKDIDSLPALINDLNVSQYLAVVPFPYEEKDAKWFVNHCKENAAKEPREGYELGIELQSTGELVGCVSIGHVNAWDGKATLGYWLGKKFWRNKIMYEATQAILEFAFNKLGLQRIDVTAAVENDASNGLIKKLGFTFEGTAKRYHRAKSTGEYHDTNLYGLLKEDWEKAKP